ncbi:hypothetical protein PICST_28797 [Scheffersomyces stipitis CBS 6054]|uniref:Uncharacterized protein n=1 Tax=Scheffersomyces stipitis (strain ATCC 58785 / CBS 6054 / NBRC 10063 / NRRL Y-11545) TaxID=322104 RepID=A3GGZ8_PICST|nr:predicted protein [Scheffersomyces stipitis CBS 6054]EAZ63620.2 hypothetical protein PICST_28797 [Scheffersomyces stipitis CBS 6054]KAG2735296.1 hypothetical protein G9P44_001510 [Scheffersomyces stipitis]
MKLTIISAIIAAFLRVVQAVSLDSSEDTFLTKLAEDAALYPEQYAQFFRTATVSAPSALEDFAKDVATFTDESFTTLSAVQNLDVSAIESFATNFPWFSSRLELTTTKTAAGKNAKTSATSSKSSSTSSSGSGRKSEICASVLA